MGKYTGIIILCDIDGTLIDNNMKIPRSNLDALEYFRSEGGTFSVCTGRTLQGANFYLERLKADIPIICQNGSAIYDMETEKYIWVDPLPKEAENLVAFVEENFPEMGIEIITPHHIYFYRESYATYLHQTNENLSVENEDYHNITSPWLKIVFADYPEKIDAFKAFMEQTDFNKEYKLIRSYNIFYEAVNKTTSKGVALEKFCEMQGLDYKNIIVAGDNDNDIEMLKSPALSFAPSSAENSAKKAADITLKSSNNQGVLPEILEEIDRIKLL